MARRWRDIDVISRGSLTRLLSVLLVKNQLHHPLFLKVGVVQFFLTDAAGVKEAIVFVLL